MSLISCARRPWKVGNTYIEGQSAAIMGVLNTTPDSFFDGGSHRSLDTQYDHAQNMISNGARIIDIGGESSRPGAAKVSEQEELDRVMPIIQKLSGSIDPLETFLSIDTTKSSVAQAACEAGTAIINDISALGADSKMIDVAVTTNASIVLNHIQGTPQTMQDTPSYTDVCTEVTAFLEEKIDQLVARGVARNKICVDPGIGFGKRLTDNYSLIWNMHSLAVLNCPILMGMSRKSYIGNTIGLEDSNRLIPSITSAVISNIAGATVLRVHDVAETNEALIMSGALQHG